MNRKFFVYIGIVLVWCFSNIAVFSQDKTLILRVCVQKNDQNTCPSSTSATFADSRLLYYSYQDEKMMKRAKDLYAKGVRYENLGNLGFARQYYQKAVDYFPGFVEAHINLGGVYLCLEDYDQAIEEFTLVTRLSSDYFSIIYNNLGLAYQGKEQLLKAEELFKTAINLDPRNVLAHNNLANLYLKMNQPARAIYHLKIVNQLDPGFLNDDVISVIAYK